MRAGGVGRVSALVFQALRRIADGRFHSGEEVSRALGRSRASLSSAFKRAPELGLTVFSVRGRGYRLARPIEFLDAAAVAAALPAGCGVALQVADEVESTSTRLLELAALGAPSGTALAAEWQSAGRGRRGRTWVAALGGSLTFSLLWRFERGAGHLGGLSLAVGLAVRRALAACGVERARVKWPNDIVVDFRKIAGILVETTGEMQGPSVAVVGVGVNVDLGEEVIDRIDQPVVDVAHCATPVPGRNALLARLLSELAATLAAFERDGFAPLAPAWNAVHAYHGRDVLVVPAREIPYQAVVTDVATDGELLVTLPDGRVQALASAEISLRQR